MKIQNLLRSVVTVSLLAGSLASADPGGFQGGFPGGGGGRGPGGQPGPSRPGGGGPDFGPGRGGPGNGPGRNDDECRDRRDPRCDDRNGGNYGPGRGGPDYGPGRGGPDYGPGRGGPGRGGPDYGPGRGPGRPPYQPPYNPPRQPPYQPPYNPPPPVYNPPPPSRGDSSIVFQSVTRRGGGEWLRVNVNYPVRIDYVQFQVLRAGVQIYEAVVVTRSGGRYTIRNLSNTGVFYGLRASEYLNFNEPIVAIDLRTEAMGDYADVQVTVIGSNQVPLTGSRF